VADNAPEVVDLGRAFQRILVKAIAAELKLRQRGQLEDSHRPL
jgi:hypothetical protein